MDRKELNKNIVDYFDEFSKILNSIDKNELVNIANLLVRSKIIVCCGNGGSYGVATHIAGDLLINTKIKANTLVIGDNIVAFTACSNDYCYEDALAIELERRTNLVTGLKTIVLISTSGKSKNILNVGKKAKEMGYYVVSMIGNDSSCVKNFSDIILSMDSKDAGFLEAAFDFVGHTLIRLVRKILEAKEVIS